MKIEQNRYNDRDRWGSVKNQLKDKAQLVFLFGSTEIMKDNGLINEVKSMYPQAFLIGCSTSGEICSTEVTDSTLVVTAVNFEYSSIKTVSVPINDMNSSFETGEELVRSLDPTGLKHVFVLSDGLNVNGSDLVRGMTAHLPPSVSVTGGLAGDSDRFKETFVVSDGMSKQKAVAAVAFYGENLKIGYGSLGGWTPFGPERLVTRSKKNVLYELDNESALGLYKKYLGEHAQKLPGSGLLFPLSLKLDGRQERLVRTVLGVNESDMSMTFAGDIPQGAYVRLMKANFEDLIDGAKKAAVNCLDPFEEGPPELSVLISCVGRKMVLKQRIEEEVESVREIFGADTFLTGYYSYGEICPFLTNDKSEFHNQTMTITTFKEAVR
jgi:hypothetical protein